MMQKLRANHYSVEKVVIKDDPVAKTAEDVFKALKVWERRYTFVFFLFYSMRCVPLFIVARPIPMCTLSIFPR